MILAKLKTKRCKVCRTPFEPRSALHTLCGYDCAVKHTEQRQAKADKQKAKAERQQLRARREKLKTRRDYLREAQAAFNAMIRARDAGLPCISCGSMPESRYGGTMDCGHYRSVGAAAHLRFEPSNAAAQCVKCNRHLGGNAVAYRAGLVARIGLDAVEALEADNAPRKWSRDDLVAMRAQFVAERKRMESK